MSSPDAPDAPDEQATATSADDVTDPTLQAEIANPGDSNRPSGADAAPGPPAGDDPPGPLDVDTTASEGEPVPEAGDAPGSDEPAAGADAAEGAGTQERGDDPAETGPAADAGPEAEDTALTPEQPEPAADAPAPAEPAAEEPDAAAPEPAPEEQDEARTALVDGLRRHLGDGVVAASVKAGREVWVRVTPEAWREAARVCREELGLTYFCFISAIDWLTSPYGKSEESGLRRAADITPADTGATDLAHGTTGGDARFQLLARLNRPGTGLGLFLKVDVPEPALTLDSWVGVYPGANWHEREVMEMFGFDFAGHPNPVKLYLPGEFEGFPLRKDFPLLAREVKPWPGLVDVEPMPGEPVEQVSTEPTEEVPA